MAAYFHEPYPARAAVGVASLPRDALVEIDAIMHLLRESAEALRREGERQRPRRPGRRTLTPHPSLSGLSNGTLDAAGEARHREQVRSGAASAAALRRRDPHLSDHAMRRPDANVLVEGTVVECDIKYRPRRQLVCHIEDGSGELTLRFFNFYGSQAQAAGAGQRACARSAKCARAFRCRDGASALSRGDGGCAGGRRR